MKFELPRAVCSQNILDAAPLFLRTKSAQVDEVPPGSRLAVHGLQMLPVLQDDGAAQDGVPCNDRIPCLPKRVYIKSSSLPTHLLDVGAAVVAQRVKEHTLLHRRQGIGVLDCGIASRQRCPGQLAQCIEESSGKALNHRVAVPGFNVRVRDRETT